MPEQANLPTLHPHICVLGALDAIEFYKTAFDAECTIALMDENDDDHVIYAQLSVFGNKLSMHDERPDLNHVSSPQDWPPSFALTVTFNEPHEVDAAIERALQSGAESVIEVHTVETWGVRYGRVRDPFGHVWAFVSSVTIN